jgi:hypothetical protein
MLTASPVVRSTAARALFFVSVAVTAALYLWTDHIYDTVGGFFLAPVFRMLFTYYDGPAAAGLLLILVLATLVARPGWLGHIAGWVSDHTLAVAAGAAVLLSAGTLVVYGDDPFTMDEFVPFFQSRIFAAGHLTGQFPVDLVDWLIPLQFQHFLEVSHATGEVASGYWPGFAVLLVPFTWLGIPWACNPVISALTLLVVHRLALELFEDRTAAGFAVLFTAASPVFFGTGISYYSEPAHLLSNALYALLLLRPNARQALAAGFVGSIALTLHNPFPHLMFALPWIAWLASRQQGMRLVAWLGAGYLPLCLLLGLGWPLFVHGLSHGGIRFPSRPEDLLGVQDPVYPTFTLIPQLGVLYARLIGIGKLWLWAVPGVIVLACAGAWNTRADVRCRLLVTSTLTTLIGYLFVGFDQGHGWGFRYFHAVWFVLPLFAAAALTHSPKITRPSANFANDDVRAFITACALLTLVVGVGQRAVQINDFVSREVSLGPRYKGDDGRIVIYTSWRSHWGNVLVHNDPWLHGKVINMFSHGREADEAMMRAHFPGMRKIYWDPWGSVWTDKPQGLTGAHR